MYGVLVRIPKVYNSTCYVLPRKAECNQSNHYYLKNKKTKNRWLLQKLQLFVLAYECISFFHFNTFNKSCHEIFLIILKLQNPYITKVAFGYWKLHMSRHMYTTHILCICRLYILLLCDILGIMPDVLATGYYSLTTNCDLQDEVSNSLFS